MRFTRRDFLKLTGLGGATLILRSKVSPPIRALRILAPSRSVPAAAMREFSQATGVRVISKQLSVISNLVISNYDVVIVSSHILTHLIRNNFIRELNLQSPISNYQLPITNYQQRSYDPFDSFSVLASRGIIGINARGITPPQTWKDFFALAQHTPTYLPSLESHNAALKSFGESINTRNTYHREKAQSLISNLKSFPLHQSQLAIAPPLDGWISVVPREGVEVWEDSYCIPVDSPQPDLAQQFIKFALSKQKLESLPAIKVEMLSAFALI